VPVKHPPTQWQWPTAGRQQIEKRLGLPIRSGEQPVVFAIHGLTADQRTDTLQRTV
jgi:hypothetical protein